MVENEDEGKMIRQGAPRRNGVNSSCQVLLDYLKKGGPESKFKVGDVG